MSGGKQNVGGNGRADSAGAGGAGVDAGRSDAGSANVDGGAGAISDGGAGGSQLRRQLRDIIRLPTNDLYPRAVDGNTTTLGLPKSSRTEVTPTGHRPTPPTTGSTKIRTRFSAVWGFPPDQYASGTVYKSGTTGGDPEIELQLRVSDSANSTRGYECFLHQGGAYISVARWRGTPLSAPANDRLLRHSRGVDNITPPKDGDLFEAQIVGNIITVKLAGKTITTVDVSKFDGVVIPSGDPGIGFDAGVSVLK